MIKATTSNPGEFNAFICNGDLHTFMHAVDLHASQQFELSLRAATPCMGFKSEKAVQHILTTNNSNHLKFPVVLTCDIAVTSLGLRVFLEDELVPLDLRSQTGAALANTFLIWFLGDDGISKLYAGTRLRRDDNSPSTESLTWRSGLVARGDTFWSSMLYSPLLIGAMVGMGKASMRRNNKFARSLFKKWLLKQCVTMGADTYTEILMHALARDQLVQGTMVEEALESLNVTTNESFEGRAQGPDERIEEVNEFKFIFDTQLAYVKAHCNTCV